jgi:hypothetical protein
MGDKRYMHLWMVEEGRQVDPDLGKPKSFWTKIGVAFENRDGSWNLHMSALPVDGRLQMREPWPKEEREGANGSGHIHAEAA